LAYSHFCIGFAGNCGIQTSFTRNLKLAYGPLVPREQLLAESCFRLSSLCCSSSCFGARRLDVDGLVLICVQPALEFLGDELRAVVGPDGLGDSVQGDGVLHEVDDVGALKGSVRSQGVTLPRRHSSPQAFTSPIQWAA
jgi:hypothetical protein